MSARDLILAIAGNERRRAADLPPGPDRDEAMGCARDMLAKVRRDRLAGR